MREELTELEHCVLGVIWRDGPLTAYEVAMDFAASLSPYWSGSAGAIYPLVKRLEGRGLIRARSRAWNGARKSLLQLTRAGEAALRAWLTPPLPQEAGAPTYDPIRSRLHFIDALPPDQREAFLSDAVSVVNTQLRRSMQRRTESEAAGDHLEALGSLGVIYELRARLRWLADVRRRLRNGR
jgi:DNA-binding PadR family transcriptional regulator